MFSPADGSVLVSQKGKRNNAKGAEGGCCGCCRANLRHERPFTSCHQHPAQPRYVPIPHANLQNEAKTVSRAGDAALLMIIHKIAF